MNESYHRPMIIELSDEVHDFVGRFCFDKRWCSRLETVNVVREA